MYIPRITPKINSTSNTVNGLAYKNPFLQKVLAKRHFSKNQNSSNQGESLSKSY